MMHQDSVKKPMHMGDVLGLYIRASIIPLIIAIVVWQGYGLSEGIRCFAGNFANNINLGHDFSHYYLKSRVT